MPDGTVFLTHLWSPGIAGHFERLKREAGPLCPVFLAFSVDDETSAPPSAVPIDILVRPSDGARMLPYRHADSAGREPLAVSGYIDLVWIPVLLHPKLEAFDRLWFVEYDVDFSGDWADFFSAAATYDADLLVAHLRRRSDEPDWVHWRDYRQPPDAPANPLTCFMPITRFSRPLLETVRETLSQPGWQGNHEAVYPTLAITRGFTVADFGGPGPLTPPERKGRHYREVYAGVAREEYTHGALPIHGYRYFEQSARLFRHPNNIYHPIKTEVDSTYRRRMDFRLFKKRLRRLFSSTYDR